MSQPEKVQTEFTVKETEDGKVLVTSNSEEVYTKERFEELLEAKRKLINERKTQILNGKARLMEIEADEDDPEIKAFVETYDRAINVIQKEKIQANLKLVELDFANLEKETLAYENFLRGNTSPNSQ